jgi:foldase protein PrsA
MAKKPSKKRAPKKDLTRKQASRLERERRMERMLIWGIIAVGVLVVGVLVYGFVVERVVKAREPVAVVDETPIRTDEFQARVRFSRMQIQNELQFWRGQQLALDPTDTDSQAYLEYIQGNIRDLEGQLSVMNALAIGTEALDQLIQEELVRQEAERRSITVEPDELQQEIEPLTPTDELISTPVPTPTPMTEDAFRQLYDTYMTQTIKPLGISEQRYRSWVGAALLTEKLREQVQAEAPTSAEQAKVRYLVVDAEERANELAGRLDAGEDFQTLIDELAAAEEPTGFGTELDWYPRSVLEGRLDTELADLAFGLEVGQHSQPVASGDGMSYAIIEIVGREERELDELTRQSLGDESFQEWLDAQQVVVERRTYEDRVPTDP